MSVTINGSGSISGVSGIASAWVNFNGTGTVAIRASGNVSSITDRATSQYTINFSSPMSDADYAMVSACNANPNNSYNNGGGIHQDGRATKTTTALPVRYYDTYQGQIDRDHIMVAVFR